MKSTSAQKCLCIFAIIVAIFVTTSASARLRDRLKTNEEDTKKGSRREGKVFSLFSVVSFLNTNCFTTSTLSRGDSPSRQGTCYTQSECVEKGGSAAGVCAAGFGVCCLFTTDECGFTVSLNNTYIRNPGYPDDYEELDDCNYQVQKCSPGICSLRLDFESFTLAGPAATDSANFATNHEPFGGVCDQDIFTVEASGGQRIPSICGVNAGEHIYVDFGSDQATANIEFEFPTPFGNTNVDREWEIRVSQIPCGANYRPPPGCLQHFTGISGTFKTFNFDTTDSPHLGLQEYSACIRREAGFCCIEYFPCRNDPDAFTLDAMEEDPIASTEENCLGDYIRIEGGMHACDVNGGSNIVNRFCGNLFSTTDDVDTGSSVVCDCTAPFAIDVFTDDLGDNLDVGEDAENNRFSKGVCLEWQQVPC